MNIEQAVTRVKEDGWTIVPGIIPEDEVAGVRESVLATIEEAESASPEWKRRVSGSFFTINQSLAPYVSDRRIVGVAEALWGRHVKITVTTPVVRSAWKQARRGGTPTGRSTRSTRPSSRRPIQTRRCC